MSLEKTLAENTAALQEQTAAIRELIVVWGKLAAAAAGKVPRVENATAAGIPLVEVARVAEPAKAEQTPAPAPAPAQAPAPAPAQAPAPAPAPAPATEPTSEPSPVAAPAPGASVPTVDDLKAAVVTRGKVHRDAIKAILAKYGAINASSVADADRAACLAEIVALEV